MSRAAAVPSRAFWLMLAVAAASAGGFYLLREHWGHLFGILPYLLFLACPLLHLVIHRGHAHRGGGEAAER